MYNYLFYVIIGIILFDFVFERILEWLNSTWRNKPVPKELKGLYDDDQYQKQQRYSVLNTRFSLISSSFSTVIILSFLFLKGFGWLHYTILPYIQNPILLGLVFFGILFFAQDIISTPFSLYDTFVIEQKFGFNKTTPKVFVFDKLKGYLVSIILGSIIYFIVYKFYELTGRNFWIYTWGIMTLFTLFMTLFYSNIIVPLFNKQKPLEEGELKSAITEFANKVGFKIQNIYEIDGSKRSTRANAYFTGFGPKKRIVLYDTLIKQLTTEELVAVLAHEIGHNKKKHTLMGFFISVLQMGLMLYILSLLIQSQELSMALGVSEPVFHIALIAFGLLFTPVSLVIGLIMNLISRKNEYQADSFVAENFNNQALISALKKLAANNLSNLTPHPVYVAVNYSHPSLHQRILNLLKQ